MTSGVASFFPFSSASPLTRWRPTKLRSSFVFRSADKETSSSPLSSRSLFFVHHFSEMHSAPEDHKDDNFSRTSRGGRREPSVSRNPTNCEIQWLIHYPTARNSVTNCEGFLSFQFHGGFWLRSCEMFTIFLLRIPFHLFIKVQLDFMDTGVRNRETKKCAKNDTISGNFGVPWHSGV